MKDEDDNIKWKNGTAIDVIGLDNNHAITLENCTENKFNLTFKGVDRGKTELSVLKVTVNNSSKTAFAENSE